MGILTKEQRERAREICRDLPQIRRELHGIGLVCSGYLIDAAAEEIIHELAGLEARP